MLKFYSKYTCSLVKFGSAGINSYQLFFYCLFSFIIPNLFFLQKIIHFILAYCMSLHKGKGEQRSLV